MIGTGLIIFLIVLFVITLIATFAVMKREENKQKAYEERGETPEEELQRSFAYEKESLKSNVPTQIWLYTVTISLSLIVFAVFVFK